MRAKNGATRLGFGCAAIPGRLTEREALTLLETTFACGVRHFDTARMYCWGQSETVLGELVRQRRDDIALVTKAGIVPESRLGRGLAKLGLSSIRRKTTGRFAADQIRSSVEASLRELKTDRLDALLLHEIQAEEVHDGLKRVLEALRAEGKIAAFGIATSVRQSEALLRAHPDLCDIVQAPAQWLDRPRKLPSTTRLIVHSVLGARLAEFMNKLAADDHLAQRFRRDTGISPGDAERIGRLMLQAAMFRNADGITLFATSRLDRVRHNAELLTATLDTPAVHALERAMALETTNRDCEQAP